MTDDPYADILGERTGTFRDALQEAVARRGGVMDPDGRTAAMPSGAAYNFDNLARAVPETATREEIIDGVEGFLGGLQESPDVRDYSWEELKPRLRTRLSANVEPQSREGLMKPLAEDLMQTLNVDFPSAVLTLTDPATLADLGVDLDRAMHIALINTAAELSQVDIDVRLIDERVWALSSSSFFTSGLVILLDEALPVLLDREFDLDDGLLIAVPNRHVVLVSFFDGPGTFVEAIRTMITLTDRLLQTQPGGISASVYYSDRHGFERVAYSANDEEGKRAIVVVPSQRLQARMEAGEI